MNRIIDHPLSRSRRLGIALLIAVAFVAGSGLAQASIIISVQSVSVGANSIGNAFDVNLTNTSGAAVDIGGFSFGLTMSDPLINFTSVTIGTASSYVFAGHSLFGPQIDTTTGPTVVASDLYDVGLFGAAVGAGATVGLGHVIFDVGAIAPGSSISVSLDASFTTLSDSVGALVTIDTLSEGTINIDGIIGAAVPEPSTLALLICGAAITISQYLVRRHRRLSAVSGSACV